MKVEGGGVATSSGPASVLHKIKVKEEAKDCCPSTVQSSVATSTSTSSSTSPPRTGIAIGAIATVTISSGCGEIAAAVAKQAGTINPNADAFPVDLDLKSKSKGGSREKTTITREDANGTESRSSSTPSPSSSPSAQYHHHQPKLTHQKPRSTSSSSARSPESDDQTPGAYQNLKTEAGTSEDGGQRQEDSKCSPETNGSSGRCISGIFAAHGKLKRLLGTLVQFAMDISLDTGDTVRTLVLGLLSGSMSTEEFHSALQEATNFPLRDFVLPYLKHALPFLQRDLNAAARADNQSCAQYLRSNEPAVLEAVGLASTGESVDPFAEHALGHSTSHHYGMRGSGSITATSAIHSSSQPAPPHLTYGHGTKRRSSDSMYYENGAAFEDGPPYGKRASNPWTQHHHHHHLPPHHPHAQQQQQQQQQQQHGDGPYCWYTQPLHQVNGPHHPSVLPSLVQPGYGPLVQPGTAHLSSHQPAPHGSGSGTTGGTQNGAASLDDEWKNIHVMLNCILGMVEKTKRALAILQRRGCSSPAAASTPGGSSLQAPVALTNGGQPPAMGNGSQPQLDGSATDRDGTFKRLSGEIVAQTIRATEDRVAEVKRRAEEAVQEVKRAAVAEVQRAVAVAVAESRANERLRSQRYLDGLPLGQRSHTNPAQHGRPSPFLRLPETTGRTPSTGTPNPTTTAASSTSTTCPDDSDKDTHIATGIGSNCWNCGRPALETCGGCGIARYCGSFCQHRDWEAGGHHASCGSTSQHHHERANSVSPSPRVVSGASSGSETVKPPSTNSTSDSVPPIRNTATTK